MALVTHRTRCALCADSLQSSSPAIMFPPFVHLVSDPLYVLHDAAAHLECLRSRPWGAFALDVHDRLMAAGSPCILCGNDARHAGFSAGFLSSDAADPAARFNFVSVHNEHFTLWSEAEEFQRTMGELSSRPAWRGPRIRFSGGPMWDTTPPDMGARTLRRPR